jgi:hypothetical protein
LEERSGRIVQLKDAPEILRAQLAVRDPLASLRLRRARLDHASPDRLRGLTGGRLQEQAGRDGLDVDVKVDPV